MKRRVFYGVGIVLLLGGCGSNDTACRMDVQKAMDKGEFDTAITQLEGACASAFNEHDRRYNLALSYMGKAGYGVSDVLISLVDADNNTNSDTFTTFTSSLSKNRKTDSSIFLQKSKEYLSQALDTNKPLEDLCKENTTDIRHKNVCFYYGFNQASTTVDTINYLTNDVDSAVQSINNDSNNTPADLQASLDALSWATNNTKISNVTSKDITIKGVQYKHLEVTEDNSIFYRLATSNAPQANASTVLTEGYCDKDGNKTKCQDIEKSDGSIDTTKTTAASCYACPVGIDITDATPSNVTSVLVDSLNNGTDVIENSTDDPDIKDSIEKLKNDVDTNHDGKIITQEIVDYLNK